jgi:DNA-binding CsgD family transcriptional regulator
MTPKEREIYAGQVLNLFIRQGRSYNWLAKQLNMSKKQVKRLVNDAGGVPKLTSEVEADPLL